MDMQGKGSGEERVELAKNGDTTAFASLYEDIYIDLYRFALYMMRNKQDAEDAVSEAVVSAFQNIHQLKCADAFRSWMFTIVSNQCKKRLSTQQAAQELQEEDCIIQENPEVSHDVHRALELLTEQERMIVIMLVLGGYNSREVGMILDLNPATVRSKQSRALAKMKRYIGEEGGA